MQEENKEVKKKNTSVKGAYASTPHEKVQSFIVTKGYIDVEAFYKAYAGQKRVYFQIFKGYKGDWKMPVYVDEYETEKQRKLEEKLDEPKEDPLAGIDYGEQINPDDIPF